MHAEKPREPYNIQMALDLLSQTGLSPKIIFETLCFTYGNSQATKSKEMEQMVRFENVEVDVC